MENRDIFYKTAKGQLGLTISWDDPKTIIDEQELGCGYAMTRIYNKAFPSKKINLTGTNGWWNWMKTSPLWEEILEPEPDCVVVYPTDAIPPQSPLKNGHIFICGRKNAEDSSYWLMSNSSATGTWEAHWTVKSAYKHYHTYGKIPPFYFRLLG